MMRRTTAFRCLRLSTSARTRTSGLSDRSRSRRRTSPENTSPLTWRNRLLLKSSRVRLTEATEMFTKTKKKEKCVRCYSDQLSTSSGRINVFFLPTVAPCRLVLSLSLFGFLSFYSLYRLYLPFLSASLIYFYCSSSQKYEKKRWDGFCALFFFLLSFLPSFLPPSFFIIVYRRYYRVFHRTQSPSELFLMKKVIYWDLTTRRTFSHLSQIRRSGFLLPFFLFVSVLFFLLPFVAVFSSLSHLSPIAMFVYLFIKKHQEFKSFCSFCPWKAKRRMIPTFLLYLSPSLSLERFAAHFESDAFCRKQFSDPAHSDPFCFHHKKKRNIEGKGRKMLSMHLYLVFGRCYGSFVFYNFE